MRGTIQIGRLLGIPIAVDLSWFFSLVWVLAIFGLEIYPAVLPGESRPMYWLLAVASGGLFFMCIILHELGHSVVARRYGIPVRSITLFVLGGVAQITRDATRPLPELLMAVAGPLVSILLGGLFLGCWWLTEDNEAAAVMWGQLGIMNIGLGLFNLAPAFPMDGGRVLRASLWGITRNFNRATRISVWVTRLLALTLLLVAIIGSVAPSRLPFEVDTISAVWLAFIGFFLLQNGNASLRQIDILQELGRRRVGDVMTRGIAVTTPSATVREMRIGVFPAYGPGRNWAFISDGARFLGVVHRAALERIPEADWDTRVAADLLIPAHRMRPVGPDNTLADVLQQIQEHDVRILPVVADGEVVGLVHESTIGRIIRR